MPKLMIDGEEIEAPEGSTILQAALAHGREIPHYCYHPGLSIAGNCRMCLVEVEKAPKLMIGCQTQVAEGMVVNTCNDRVKEAQAAVQEFLLINHPLDCPICDQAGECRLQDYAVAHGTGVSRYTEPKLALNKAVDIGNHVMLDQERCIHCSRCIRFCDEVTGTSELAFFQRGNRAMIGIYPGAAAGQCLLGQRRGPLPGGCTDAEGVPLPYPRLVPQEHADDLLRLRARLQRHRGHGQPAGGDDHARAARRRDQAHRPARQRKRQRPLDLRRGPSVVPAARRGTAPRFRTGRVGKQPGVGRRGFAAGRRAGHRRSRWQGGGDPLAAPDQRNAVCLEEAVRCAGRGEGRRAPPGARRRRRVADPRGPGCEFHRCGLDLRWTGG